ncbi:MAG: hypothetical protein ACFFHD_13725 [Promethearchaeota archaeon]
MQSWDKYLLKNEKILWHKGEIVNLVYFIKGIIIFIACSIVIGLILDIYLIYNIKAYKVLTLTIVFLTIDIILILLAFYNYRKRKKRLQSTYKELKNYEEFDILTNLRFIRRNYYLNYKVDLSRYIFEKVVDQIDDVVFLKLENIKGIIIDYQVKEINFIFNDECNFSPFYIKFMKMNSNEIEEIIEIITQILNLERVEKFPRYEKYIRKI